MMNILVLLKPKSQIEYIEIDYSIRQTMEKLQHYHFTAIPIIDKEGKYVGTITEGDLLWFIKDTQDLSYKSSEKISIMDVPRHHDNSALNSTNTIEDLLDLAVNQNFVPVKDDSDIFIGIVTRKSILEYYKTLNI